MPTYEYKCAACGHAFEAFQSIKAPAIRKCPECGKNKVDRLISSGAGLIFKGSGFYITDYRDSAYTESAKKDSAAPATPAADAGATKPAGDAAAPAAAKPAEVSSKGESKSESKDSSAKSSEKPTKSSSSGGEGGGGGGKSEGKRRK